MLTDAQLLHLHRPGVLDKRDQGPRPQGDAAHRDHRLSLVDMRQLQHQVVRHVMAVLPPAQAAARPYRPCRDDQVRYQGGRKGMSHHGPLLHGEETDDPFTTVRPSWPFALNSGRPTALSSKLLTLVT